VSGRRQITALAAPSATLMALACHGTIPADSLLDGDVQVIVAR
jgi:hypothetical protein